MPVCIWLAIKLGAFASALTVSVPSPIDLFNDKCAAFRLPPKAVNGTFLDQVAVERPWIEPPFGFGYGKWALAWTTIEEYWGWSNMQVWLRYDSERRSGKSLEAENSVERVVSARELRRRRSRI
jgi:hypothetical protein